MVCKVIFALYAQRSPTLWPDFVCSMDTSIVFDYTAIGKFNGICWA